jgi:ABC-type methionine transport system ATPase subunit
MVGLGHMSKKRPDQLSGGEQQRVAIAVAIANEPKLLLADEPTGELDSVTASEIFTLLRQLSRQLGLTIITVTHDAAVAAATDRTIAIRDGRTSTETVRRGTTEGTINGLVLKSSAIIGLSSETHRESILIDRVGRLQLPKEALERILFKGRAEVRIADDHIELWPLTTAISGEESSDILNAQNGNGQA